MTTDTVDAECKNGHRDTYPGPSGRSIKCRKCRVGLYLKKGNARPPDATSGVWADEETHAPAATVVEDAPEHPCPECGGPQGWTPGRTALLCSECGATHLPPAVYDRTPDPEPDRAAVVALTPEQEIDARIKLEHNRTKVVMTLDRAAGQLDPAALSESRDRAEAFDTAAMLTTLRGMARSAATIGDLAMIYQRGRPALDSARWLVAQADADQEEYEEEEYEEEEYEEEEYDAAVVDAEVIESPRPALPSPQPFPALGMGWGAASGGHAYVTPRSEAYQLRQQQAEIRAQYGECETATHRTWGFPYHPLTQYRVTIPASPDPANPWYPNQTEHVADCCPRCADRIARANPETTYEVTQLWDGPNPRKSHKPAALVALAVLALAGWVWWTNRERYGYGYGW
jgi:hypothetical protein